MLYPNASRNAPSSGPNSEFGPRKSPGGIGSRLHQGWDSFGYTYNCAIEDGTVTSTAYNSGWGNLIKVSHGNGVTSWYAHNKTGGILVSVGQRVSKGQRLGIQGATGNVTGVHLHLEVRINNVPQNPRLYIAKRLDNGPLTGGSTPGTPNTPAPPVYDPQEGTDMYIFFDTTGVGYLMTINGIHGLTLQLANLFRRQIRADQNKDVPDTLLRAEIDMMASVIRLMKVADQVNTSIDADKLASALSDKLGKTLTVDAELDPEELSAALEASVGRIAKAMLKTQGAALGTIS